MSGPPPAHPTLLPAMECGAGLEYRGCGPAAGPTCADMEGQGEQEEEGEEGLCVEGCYCPEGTVLWQGGCVARVGRPLPTSHPGLLSVLP